MVLNIKKLEHAVSHSDVGSTKLPPESPLAKTKPTSPHTSLGTRIVSLTYLYLDKSVLITSVDSFVIPSQTCCGYLLEFQKAPNKGLVSTKWYCFLISPKNIYCGYSLEAHLEGDSNEYQQYTLQPLYNTVCYNTVLDITRFKDGSQKCFDYIEK